MSCFCMPPSSHSVTAQHNDYVSFCAFVTAPTVALSSSDGPNRDDRRRHAKSRNLTGAIMPRGRRKTDEELKTENEAYLRKTRRWGNISGYPYLTVREVAYLIDVTPAEVWRRINSSALPAWRVAGYRGVRIWYTDITIVRYPPFEPRRFDPRIRDVDDEPDDDS